VSLADPDDVASTSRLSRLTLATLFAVAIAILAWSSAVPAAGSERIPMVRGGESTMPGELPSLAFVEYLIPNGKGEAFVCTGTVIAPRLALTAAHCAMPSGVRFNVENFRVITGDVNRDGPDRQVLDVVRVATFPQYNSYSGVGDAALLRLATPTEAPSIPLAGRRIWSVGSPAEVAGWGVTHLGQHRATYLLHRASMAVLSYRECEPLEAHPGQICAEDAPPHKATACFGDSGGPLLMHRPGDHKLVQIGVVHGGENCDPKYPSLYTSTSAIFNWASRERQKARTVPPETAG
jgi:secreted trypsin-like serine protease